MRVAIAMVAPLCVVLMVSLVDAGRRRRAKKQQRENLAGFEALPFNQAQESASRSGGLQQFHQGYKHYGGAQGFQGYQQFNPWDSMAGGFAAPPFNNAEQHGGGQNLHPGPFQPLPEDMIQQPMDARSMPGSAMGFFLPSGLPSPSYTESNTWEGVSGRRPLNRFDLGMSKRKFRKFMRRWAKKHPIGNIFDGKKMPKLLGGLKKLSNGALMQKFKMPKGKKIPGAKRGRKGQKGGAITDEFEMLMQPDKAGAESVIQSTQNYAPGHLQRQVVLYVNGEKISDPAKVKRMLTALGMDSGKMMMPMMAGGTITPSEIPPEMMSGFIDEVVSHFGHVPGVGRPEAGSKYHGTVQHRGLSHGGGMPFSKG